MTVSAPPQPVDTEAPTTLSRRLTRVATLVLLVAAVLIAVVLGAWFRNEATKLTGSAAASNDALADSGTTAEVSAQISDAVQRVYSYDFARLDDNERAATQVVTGPFVEAFRKQFARVRELAPSQQAVVVAKVPAVAVKSLDGDRAIVLVFLDQQAQQVGKDKPMLATGRLSITAHRVDGHWKIADAESF
jgi:Mce-associated membrane protein